MTTIKLDSVSFFNNDYTVERCDQGNAIVLTAQKGSSHIGFPARDWPQIQDLVNVAMAAYPAAQVFEKLQEEDTNDG